MKNLSFTFFLAIILHLVAGVGGANALPKCTDPSWRDNCEDTMKFFNGDKYRGEWRDNKPHGLGIMYFFNGDKYQGDWRDKKRHGWGIFTFANRNMYVGAWKDDTYHGPGTYIYADGDIKEGIWRAGKFLYAQKAPASGKSTAEKENARLKKQQQAQSKKIAKKPVKKSPLPKSSGTGSGFFVSKLGHIVTNEHVVRNCGSITVGDSSTNQVGATLLEKDKRNDLALLRISSTQMASAESKALISKLGLRVEISTPSIPLASGGLLRPDDVELGEDLLVSGYPYGDIFSNTIKVTKGIVSANKGMGDDSSQFQMDAAVQAGNSGGPIYDENGNIVGVVVQQLNKLKVAKVIGSMPENVNFGIKASTVRQFLTAAGLPTKWSNRSKKRSTKDLAKIAKNQTVMVVCNP